MQEMQPQSVVPVLARRGVNECCRCSVSGLVCMFVCQCVRLCECVYVWERHGRGQLATRRGARLNIC